MNTEGTGDNSPAREDISKSQMALIAQLFQVVMSMHHIDEMFQWLAYAIVQHFNIQVTQFWTNQMNPNGRLVTQLRMIVCQDPTLPEKVVVNDHIAYIAQRVISERRSYRPQPVETIFPSYQAAVLKRYGLSYCGACFTSSDFLLPPPESIFSNERSPTSLALTTLLWSAQSLPPDLIPAISIVLEQAIAVAGNRGLLLPVGAPMRPQVMLPFTPTPASPFTPTPASPFAPQPASPFTPTPASQFTPHPMSREAVPALELLIPRRRSDADLMLTDNPFGGAAIISDKKARRLYAAIDGHANLASLCDVTGMSMKEVHIALQKLLGQQRIELYEPGGQPVNVLPFLKDI